MNTRILASEVAVGDNLFTPEGVYRVTQIDAWDLTSGKPVYPPYHQQGGPSWPVLRILTECKGYARFPHETVQVENNDVTLGAGDAS